MKFNKPLIAAAYLTAAIMIVMPLLEVVLSIAPFRLGVTAWRFGALGVVSQAYLTPLLGAVVVIYTAVLLGHSRTARIGGAVVLLLAVLLLLAVPFFALDTIQMRVSVRREALRAFDRSALIAALKLFAAGVAGVVLGIGAWKASRRSSGATRAHVIDGPLVRS